ncbi:MAG: hypothetical protein FJ033_00090 [Chloroflexi bacterium]|nr:hypothetical protein [Chloroflexota bacterium]
MAHTARRLSRAGVRRSAVLFISLGPDLAAPLLAALPDEYIEAITREIGRSEQVTEAERLRVLRSCVVHLGGGEGARGGRAFAHSLLVERLGPDRAGAILERATDPVQASIAAMTRVEPRKLATYLVDQPPATIATVMGRMPREFGGRVLAALPASLQTEVVQAIARGGTAASISADAAVRAIHRHLAPAIEESTRRQNGMRTLRRIVDAVPGDTAAELIEPIERVDPALAAQLRQRVFAVDDLPRLSDRMVQSVIRDIAPRTLALAMRAALPATRDCVMRNLSRRSATTLMDEIDGLGPVTATSVREAQSVIGRHAQHIVEGDATPLRSAVRGSVI